CNLTLDGSSNTDGELYSGIRVIEGGSATVWYNTITGLTTASDPQFGIAVQVGASHQGTMVSQGTAKVEHNTITDYLGAGVVVDAAGSAADVRDNTISGSAAASGVAQYGVQLSYGATGRVEQNTISDNSADSSAAVLLFQVSGKSNVVARNSIDNND